MTEARYKEIKEILTSKRWNSIELAEHAERLLPELFDGIEKGDFEAEIEPVPAEQIETKVGPAGEPAVVMAEEPEEPAEDAADAKPTE